MAAEYGSLSEGIEAARSAPTEEKLDHVIDLLQASVLIAKDHLDREIRELYAQHYDHDAMLNSGNL